LPPDRRGRLERALIWACRFGQTGTAALLIAEGVDVAAGDKDRMTALHWAAANRRLEVIELLLRGGAPLEAKNRWGGTVLSSTVHIAVADGKPSRYAPVLEKLLDAGADASVFPYPTGHDAVDAVLARHVRDDA
jgi:hypothetical protein